ncbi:MAG: c-type cytochrome [Ignavibacterium sp.]|jgi:cytochrome c oxidase cbb3-type subunit 3|nr:c-type cytochrome [Ignavibacterium sp.]
MKRKLSVFNLMFLSILFGFQEAYATTGSDFPPSYYDVIAIFLIAVILISFIALIYYEGKESKIQKGESFENQSSVRNQHEKYNIKTTSEILINEHLLVDKSIDAKKLVNNVPSWFMWLFYTTIFAVIAFLINYHILNMNQLQTGKNQTEVKQAGTGNGLFETSSEQLDEVTVTLLTDPSSLNFGKQIFDANCAACHSNDGGGLVGPNLTDDYWIHGGGIKNVFSVTKYGVPEKGMISWRSILSPKQIQEVASYVISMHGKTTANPKQPEGDLWKDSE